MPVRARKQATLVALTIALAQPAPTEFRIFTSPEVVTSKGTFLFDAAAAKAVIAEYEVSGVDLMIDYDHASLSQAIDPALAGKAAGWFNLELRGAELWAVNVRWTEPAAQALARGEWRFVSPAFKTLDSRIIELFNVAITNMPATRQVEPLVAANRVALSYAEEGPMTPEQFAQIAEALGLGADANVEDVIATISAMVKKVQDAANGTPPAEDTAAVAADAPKPGEPEVMAAAKRVSAAARTLARLTGRADIGEVVSEIETWQKSHLELESGRTKLATDRATLESGERRKLVGELVKLGAETPATAWAEDAHGVPDGKTPCKRLTDEPIAELRTRVARLAKARGVEAPVTTTRHVPAPPATDGKGGMVVMVNNEAVELSASEVTACKAAGAKPEDYAANKQIRDRARAAKRTA